MKTATYTINVTIPLAEENAYALQEGEGGDNRPIDWFDAARYEIAQLELHHPADVHWGVSSGPFFNFDSLKVRP
jgi:hypothetical protein